MRHIGAQPLEITGRIAHAVRMIHPQPVDRAGRNLVQDQRVGRLVDVGIFHPQADERVDIEEAAVAEVARRGGPARQAPVLPPDERVERLRIRIDGCHPLRDPAFVG